MKYQVIKLLKQWQEEKERLIAKVPTDPKDIERVQVLAECAFELEMILNDA